MSLARCGVFATLSTHVTLILLLVAHSQMPQRTEGSTFVDQIFGGWLRSRVTCSVCEHSSDKYESVLDLSVDVGMGVRSVEAALRQFTKVEPLSGSNKWQCDE